MSEIDFLKVKHLDDLLWTHLDVVSHVVFQQIKDTGDTVKKSSFSNHSTDNWFDRQSIVNQTGRWRISLTLHSVSCCSSFHTSRLDNGGSLWSFKVSSVFEKCTTQSFLAEKRTRDPKPTVQKCSLRTSSTPSRVDTWLDAQEEQINQSQ